MGESLNFQFVGFHFLENGKYSCEEKHHAIETKI